MELFHFNSLIANPGEISGWSLLTRMLMFYIVAFIILVIGLVQHAQRNRRTAKNVIVYGIATLPLIGACIFSWDYFKYANDDFVQSANLVGSGSDLIYKGSFIGSVLLLIALFVIARIADKRVENAKERV